MKKQQRSAGVSEEELIKIAVKSMGLDELAPFDPQRKIIEYNIAQDDPAAAKKLVRKDLRAFANEAASESVAPGGGSVSCYIRGIGCFARHYGSQPRLAQTRLGRTLGRIL